MKKRILSMLLVIALVFSMGSVAFAAPIENYTDVEKGTWYYEYVKDVVTEGYYIGYNDTTFGPEDHMTRAQMVTVLARLAGVTVDGEDVNDVDAGFEDVAEGDWYAAAVKWAHDTGITTGVTLTEFWPNVDVTREDACTFIIRFIGYMAEQNDVTYDHLKNEDLIFEFVDEDKIRDYSAAAVDECMAYGLVWGDTGDETGTFRPQDAWKRSEGAKMISILADILENGKSTYVPPYTPPSGGDDDDDDVFDITYTAEVTYWYSTNGETWTEWATETQQETIPSNAVAAVVFDFVSVAGPTAGYETETHTYTFAGWTDVMGNPVNEAYAPGVTFSIYPNQLNVTLDLYAVYTAEEKVVTPDEPTIPEDDYVKLAVQGAIDAANEYIAEAEELTITAGSHDATVGSFVTADDITLDIETNVISVSVYGELDDSVVVKVIELATEYAVALIADEANLPTKNDVKDVVTDVADSVGIVLDGKTIEEIAEEVYNKVHAIGADIFSNFRNYNGNFCIDAISLVNGETTVATVQVTNENGLTTDGATGSKAAVKKMAVAIAKALYADLKTQEGSVITLNTTLEVAFSAVYENEYNNNYTLDLTATVESDMFYYDYNEETNTNTLYLVVTEDLQAQYAESVQTLVEAVYAHETVQAELEATLKSAMTEALTQSSLIETVSEYVTVDATAAVEAWIDANLAIAGTDAQTLFQFLWTNEGTITVEDGVYTAYVNGTEVTLGVNDALYTMVTDLCEKIAVKVAEIAEDTAAAQFEAALPGVWDRLEAATKLDLISAAVKVELESAGITGDFYVYVSNLCIASVAGNLDLPMDQALALAAANAKASSVNTLVDQMILEAVAGVDLTALDKAYKLKTVERVATIDLGNVVTLLNNATVQDVVAQYGDSYVHYLAKAIAKLPADASVTVEGVVISKATLEKVQAAAAGDDAAAVCSAVAEFLNALNGVTLNTIVADPLTVTVQYGARSVTVDLGLMIH